MTHITTHHAALVTTSAESSHQSAVSRCWCVSITSLPIDPTHVEAEPLMKYICSCREEMECNQTSDARMKTIATSTLATTATASPSITSVSSSALHSRLLRFHFVADRIRAVLARLIVVSSLSAISALPVTSLHFRRSIYGKPRLINSIHQLNRDVVFNVSHHGDYVVMAIEANDNDKSEMHNAQQCEYNSLSSSSSASSLSSTFSSTLPLLGCDITTYALHANCVDVDSYLDCMSDCFTEHEWTIIRDINAHQIDPITHAHSISSTATSSSITAPCSTCRLIRFAWMWSLKESLIKAIGMGLSFPLLNMEFRFVHSTQTALFNPIQVTFITHANTSMAASTLVSTSISLSSDPTDVIDVQTDIEWQFDSTMLTDHQHIVSRCRGWKKKNNLAHYSATVNHNTQSDMNRSLVDCQQLKEFNVLGNDISFLPQYVHSTLNQSAISLLSVRQLTLQQLLPSHLKHLVTTQSSTH